VAALVTSFDVIHGLTGVSDDVIVMSDDITETSSPEEKP